MRSSRKMAVVTFIVLCAFIVAAAFTFKDNSWKQIINPEQGFAAGIWLTRLAWMFMVGSVLSFGAMGYVHSVVAEKYAAWKNDQPDTRKSPSLTPDEQWVKDRIAEGFHEFKPISVKQPDGSEKSVRVFAQPERPTANNIITRTVTLKDADGESSFTYSILFDDFSWKRKSERQFKGKGSRGIPIESALQDEYLRSGLEAAPRILCIGLASQEAETLTDAENEALSDARGMNLGIALLNMGYVKKGPQTTIGIGGGYATQAPDEVADTDKQRVAIVIAVHYNTAKEFEVEPFVVSMNQLISVKGVDLAKYSRDPADFVTSEALQPGNYLTIEDITYSERMSKVVVPLIPKPVPNPSDGG